MQTSKTTKTLIHHYPIVKYLNESFEHLSPQKTKNFESKKNFAHPQKYLNSSGICNSSKMKKAKQS